MRTVFFDMDNTLNRFYEVEGWLDYLLAGNPTPYIEAGVLHNMSRLARYLNRMQAAGYRIGIISWLSKTSTPEFDEAVTAAKLAWLRKHLKSVSWDEIHIVAYGTPKYSFADETDILFDDEPRNRDDWGGEAFEPDEIFKILKQLLEGE